MIHPTARWPPLAARQGSTHGGGMRALVPLACCLFCAAGEEPAPMTVQIHLGDLPLTVEVVGKTWLGRFLASDACAPEWAAVTAALTRLRSDAGVALPTTLEEIQALTLALGDEGAQVQVDAWLAADATGVLSGVDQALVAQEARGAERGTLMPLGQASMDGLYFSMAMLPIAHIPVARHDGLVRFAYEPWLASTGIPQDGWAMTTAGTQVSLWHLPPTAAPQPPQRPAAKADVTASLMLGTLMSDTGLPLMHALGKAMHMGRADLTITTDGEDLRERLLLPGVDLPLRPVSLTGLTEQIPTTTRALTLIGLDGPRLGALAQALVAIHPAAVVDPAVIAACSAMSGTAWVAVTSDGALPALVIGLPASAALDTAMAGLAPSNPALVERARQHPVSLPAIRGLCARLAARRLENAWLISTDPDALQHLGAAEILNLIQREVDGQALAVAWQDTSVLAGEFATNVFARQWLGLQFQHAAERSDDAMVNARRVLLRTWCSRALRWLQGLQQHGRTTSWRLVPDSDGLRLDGHNVTVGVATMPIGLAWWWYGLPLAWPDEGVCSRFRSLARHSGDRAPVETGFLQDFHERLTNAPSMPHAREEALLLFSEASGPRTRADALGDLINLMSHPQEREAALTLLLQATRDPCREPRVMAWGRLVTFLTPDGKGPAPLRQAAIAALQHPDPAARQGAAGLAVFRSAQRRFHRMNRALIPVEQQPAPPPPALLEPLLAALEREADRQTRVGLVDALSGYDDPRLAPLLRQWVFDAEPGVRAIAAQVLLTTQGIADEPAVFTACLKLLMDDTPCAYSTVGKLVTDAAMQLDDPAVTTALSARFDHLAQQGRLSEELPDLITTLCERGYPPAINEVIRRLEHPQGVEALQRYLYLRTLGNAPRPEAETAVVGMLDQQRIRTDELSAVIARLGRRAALQDITITHLIPFLESTDAQVRRTTREALRRQHLNDAQQAAMFQCEQKARTKFGPTAFAEERQREEEPDQPKATDVKDF